MATTNWDDLPASEQQAVIESLIGAGQYPGPGTPGYLSGGGLQGSGYPYDPWPGVVPSTSDPRQAGPIPSSGMVSPGPGMSPAPAFQSPSWGPGPGASVTPFLGMPPAPPAPPGPTGLPLSSGIPPTVSPGPVAPPPGSLGPPMGSLGGSQPMAPLGPPPLPQGSLGGGAEDQLAQLYSQAQGLAQPMRQLTPLDLMAATWGTNKSPLDVIMDQRRQALEGILGVSRIGLSLKELEEKRAERVETRADKIRNFLSTQADRMTKSDNEDERQQGWRILQQMGLIGQGEETVQRFARDNTLGLGKSPAGALAAQEVRARVAAGKPLQPEDLTQIIQQSNELAQQKDATERYATVLKRDAAASGTTLTDKEALLKAHKDFADAQHQPPLSVYITDLRMKGETVRANAILQVAKEIAEAGVTPPSVPGAAVDKVIGTSTGAEGVTRLLKMFDPSVLGVIGKLKGFSTRISEVAGTPQYPKRLQFSTRLNSITAGLIHDKFGGALSPQELERAMGYLADLNADSSVLETALKLDALAEMFSDVLRATPRVYQSFGYRNIPSLDAQANELDKLRKNLAPYIQEAPVISKSEYLRLLNNEYGNTEASLRSTYRSDGTW